MGPDDLVRITDSAWVARVLVLRVLCPQCSPNSPEAQRSSLFCLLSKIVGRGQGTECIGLKCHRALAVGDCSLLNQGHLCADRDNCHIGEDRKQDIDKTTNSPSDPGHLLSCSWSPEAVPSSHHIPPGFEGG